MDEKTVQQPYNDISEEEKIGDVLQRYIQKETFNASERVLCSYLVESISGDPLQCVIFIMRAAMLLEVDKITILEIDLNIVESIYVVSQLIATPAEILINQRRTKSFSINFSSLNWEKDLAHWVKRYTYNHWLDIKNEETINKKIAFISSSKNLTEEGYNHLKADFLWYAMPIAQRISQKIAKTISPATFTETLQLFKQYKRE